MTTNYPASNVINANLVNYSGTASNILAPDNIHPNQLGHYLTYVAILNTIGPTIKNVYQNYAASQGGLSGQKAGYILGDIYGWLHNKFRDRPGANLPKFCHDLSGCRLSFYFVLYEHKRTMRCG